MNKTRKIWIIILLVIVISINGFIIFQSCLPGGSSSKWSNVAVDIYKTITGTPKEATESAIPGVTISEFVRKLFGHFSLFFVDGVFSFLFIYLLLKDYPKDYFKIILGCVFGIFIASLSETIQLFVPGRVGVFTDVAMDAGGFIASVLIVYLVIFIIKKVRDKKQKSV